MATQTVITSALSSTINRKSPENPIRRVKAGTRIAKSASPLGSPRPAPCISAPPTVIISAPPAASRQSSEPAPSRASGPSPPCAAHASSGPSGCAPTPRTCVGQCWRRHASCTSRRPSLVPCKACPFWFGRHIAGRLEPRAGLFANRARAAWGFPATSKSSLPLPHLRYCRLDIANDRLTTLMRRPRARHEQPAGLCPASDPGPRACRSCPGQGSRRPSAASTPLRAVARTP